MAISKIGLWITSIVIPQFEALDTASELKISMAIRVKTIDLKPGYMQLIYWRYAIRYLS